MGHRMQRPIPLTRDLVLIGGGHAHALLLRRWAMRPLPGARLTLIDPSPMAVYTGMLPGYMAGHYPLSALEIDLVRLARCAGARLIPDRAIGIDRSARRVLVADRPGIAYDAVSFDIGITSAMPDLPGFTEHAWPAKPMGPMAAAWARFVAGLVPGDRPRAVVIGGGIAGVELALAMGHRLRSVGTDPQITILETAAAPLSDVGGRTRSHLCGALDAAGVALRTGTRPIRVEAGAVVLDSGEPVASDFTLGAAGARPWDWLAQTGLDLVDGYITVGPTLQSPGDKAVFAAGDCAHLSHAPRPKAGVFAVRAAPILHHNLRAVLSGGRLRSFNPQRDYLKLISIGGRHAVADKWGWSVAGPRLWRQKDRIDRSFMSRLQSLPQMPEPRLPQPVALGVDRLRAAGPLCGGCGAKAPAQALAAGLPGLPAPRRADVVTGPGQDAAVLRHGTGFQVLSTDQLRGFTADPWLLARIAAVHALGDIWAMGAQPQSALVQITLPEMSARLAAETMRDITDAAVRVLSEAGADLIGGHTSLGAEAMIGFTVTGLADRVIGIDGAMQGDALIVTKPLGTGVILAAEMQMQARGRDVMAALDSMARPVATDAAILAPAAHAMTDVTGFGLAGHLQQICAASGIGAELDLDALPILDGAADLAARGVRARLWADNRDAAPVEAAGQDGRATLLHDPQTAGGLLAAVPATAADRILGALRAAQVPAARIGQMTDAPARIGLCPA